MRLVVLAAAVAVSGGSVAIGHVTDEITSLSVSTASNCVVQYKDSLSLNGLTNLSREAAVVLGNHEGRLFLNGLTTLTPDAAAGLALHKRWLVLNGLTELSPAAAEQLIPHKGWLSLNGIESLSPELGTLLVRHRGRLFLDGVKEILPDVAEILATNRGVELSLDGLTTLSAEATEILRRNPKILVPRKFR